jgi:hypothetical protein
MCNMVARSKATGLTYGNIEWVNACAVLPLTRLALSGFSPFQALTRPLHYPRPAQGASPPGRSVVDGLCRDERTRDIPQSLLDTLVSAVKPTTGIQVVRVLHPSCLNSLTPDAHRAGPLHPIADEALVPRCTCFPASLVADPVVALLPKMESLRGSFLQWEQGCLLKSNRAGIL